MAHFTTTPLRSSPPTDADVTPEQKPALPRSSPRATGLYLSLVRLDEIHDGLTKSSPAAEEGQTTLQVAQIALVLGALAVIAGMLWSDSRTAMAGGICALVACAFALPWLKQRALARLSSHRTRAALETAIIEILQRYPVIHDWGGAETLRSRRALKELLERWDRLGIPEDNSEEVRIQGKPTPGRSPISVDPVHLREELAEAIIARLRVSIWGAARVLEIVFPAITVGLSVVVCMVGLSIVAAGVTPVLLGLGVLALFVTLPVLLGVLRWRRHRIARAEARLNRVKETILANYPEARQSLGPLQFNPSEAAYWELVRYLDERCLGQDALLHVRRPGRFVLLDRLLYLSIDGQALGKGSMRNGLELTASLTSGTHLLRIQFSEWGRETTLNRYVIIRIAPGTITELNLVRGLNDWMIWEETGNVLGPYLTSEEKCKPVQFPPSRVLSSLPVEQREAIVPADEVPQRTHGPASIPANSTREEVLLEPENRALRERYLAQRTPQQAKADARRGRMFAALWGARLGAWILLFLALPAVVILLVQAMGGHVPRGEGPVLVVIASFLPLGTMLEGAIFGGVIGWLAGRKQGEVLALLGPLPWSAFRLSYLEARQKFLGDRPLA